MTQLLSDGSSSRPATSFCSPAGCFDGIRIPSKISALEWSRIFDARNNYPSDNRLNRERRIRGNSTAYSLNSSGRLKLKMDFYCVFCGVICPTYCYPTHKEDFACHNVQCSGHAPVTTPLSSPQNPHLNGGGQIQGQELSKISNGVVGDHNQITATQPAAPPPPPHIQYFLHGIKSPREQSSHLGAYKGSKSHEYHKGRWRMSQVGPVRTQSAAQVLKNQPSMSKIKKGLYVGNLACIKTEGFLETMGITAVVSVLTRPRGADPTHPLNKAIALEDQLFVKAYDHPSQDIIQHFPGACEFIDKRLVCLLSVPEFMLRLLEFGFGQSLFCFSCMVNTQVLTSRR